MFTYGPGMTAIIILTVNKLGIALQFSFYIRHLLMSIIQVTYLSTKGFSNLTIGYHIAILCFAKYNLYHESVLWIRNPGLLRFGFLFQRVKLLQQNFLHPIVFNWSKKWNVFWAQQSDGLWWIKFIEIRILQENLSIGGSGCGWVGRAVALDNRDPRIQSSHHQFYLKSIVL